MSDESQETWVTPSGPRMAWDAAKAEEPSELAAMPCSPPWDYFALEVLEAHAKALKAKCEEITHRCLLPTVTDYTVKMALRELQAANTESRGAES